ncbi:MAG TPA: MFS transporter [Jiangellaceae bacterium]|nr:MFS transporter [Jiangellaceae bacterium]
MTTEPVKTVGSILDPDHRRLTIGIIATIAFIAFEAMAVATAMPRAVRDLDGLPMYAWAFSGFFTTSLFAMVLSGELCDRRGPRFPLVLGAGSFTAGLLVAGTAQSMWPFVAGRAIQGLGAGLAIVALYVVIARGYEDALRPRIFAALAAAWVLPSIVGPLVAGSLADHASWRLVFIGVAPLVVLPVALALPQLRAYDGPPPGGSNVRKGRLRLAAAAAIGVGVLQAAGLRRDAVAIGMVVAAMVLLVPSVPRLLPPGTLRLRRGLSTVIAMRGILAGSFFGAEAFLPLMLVDQRGLSATLAGLALTGGALGWASGSWYQGRPSMTIPRHLLLRMGSGLVAFGIGAAGLVLIPAVPAFVAAAAWTVGAVGMGLCFASIGVLLFKLSPPADHGANSAALQLCDSLFVIIFVGLAGVIFGSTHEAAGGTHPAAYVSILAVMVTLASVGVWASGRVRPRDDTADSRS